MGSNDNQIVVERQASTAPQPFPIPFEPHPLLRNRHAQSIAGVYLPGLSKRYRAARHFVDLPDGDQIVLHDDVAEGWQAGDRVALIVPGLGSCYATGYIVRLAARLNQHGVRTFRMDHRGIGASFGISRHPGHAGRSEDVLASLELIGEHCPTSAIALVGLSLGGNISLKLLGELGDNAPPSLDRAMVVAPPVDIMPCSQRLQLGLSRLYDRRFARILIQHLRRQQRVFPDLCDVPLRPRPKTLLQFDDRITAPLSGFADAKEYYAASSSAPLLKHIRVPTYLLTAADDPLIPPAVFEETEMSPSITLQITDHGGHLGFIGRAGVDPDRRWMDWRVVDWVTGNSGPD